MRETARLDRDYANLHAALTWFAAIPDGGSLMRLAAAVYPLWETTGRWSDGATWLDQALASDPRPTLSRAEVLASRGFMFDWRGDTARGECLLREAVEIAYRLEAPDAIASMQASLAAILIHQGRYAEAEPLLVEAITLARSAGDRDLEAIALQQAGLAASGMGDTVTAIQRLEQARTIWLDFGYPYPAVYPNRHLANIATSTGEFDRAADEFREFLAYARDAPPALARVVTDIAVLAALRGEPERAARLFGAGDALATEIGLVPALSFRGLHDRGIGAARAAIGHVAFDDEFTTGTGFSRCQLETELAATLDAVPRTGRNSRQTRGTSDHADLSPRELEVLRLLSWRLTDREIADRLFVTRRTASKHVAAILAKLGVHDRRAAAAEGRRQGLVRIPSAETER
jgi:non-specific serine/threonine protein kinase